MNTKKLKRLNFCNNCMTRDSYRCAACKCPAPEGQKPEDYFDVHHIVDRHDMSNGGYVKENGITLCPYCHEKAEVFHATGKAFPGYSAKDLFEKIGSSKEEAVKASIDCL